MTNSTATTHYAVRSASRGMALSRESTPGNPLPTRRPENMGMWSADEAARLMAEANTAAWVAGNDWEIRGL